MDKNLFPYFIYTIKTDENNSLRASTRSLSNIRTSKNSNTQKTFEENLQQDITGPQFARLVTIAEKGVLQQSQIEQMSKLIQQNSEYFNKVCCNWVISTNKILSAITKTFQCFLQKQDELDNHILEKILHALTKWKKTLQFCLGYELFLALVEINLKFQLSQPVQKVISFFPVLVAQLALLEANIKQNEQYFQRVRKFLKIGVYIMTFSVKNKVSVNFQSLMQNSSIQFEQGQKEFAPQITIDHNDYQSFYQNLSRYALIDPQLRIMLLKTITQLFKKGLESDHVFELIKICSELMQKKIFQHYEIEVLQELLSLRQLVNSQNSQLFNKMVFTVLQNSSPELLKQHKRYILRLSVNQEITILLFSLYYQIGFAKNKQTQCDSQILNSLVVWNVKYGMIPVETFLPDLIKIGLDKLSQNSEKIIFSSNQRGWNDLAVKIVQNKCKQYLSGNLKLQPIINDKIFSRSAQVYVIYSKMFIQVLTNISADKFKSSTPVHITIQVPVQTITQIRQHTLIMFKKAVVNEIKDAHFLQSFCLLKCLVETVENIRLDDIILVKYYTSLVSELQDKQIQQILPYLLKVFKIFKSSYILFITFISGINIFNKRKQNDNLKSMFNYCLEQINKITRNEGFAKIISYHFRNLQLLVILTYICKSQSLTKLCQQMIANWAALYNKADIYFIMYQFDKSLFGNLFESLGCLINPNEQPEKFIMNTLDQLLILLLHPQCINTQYLSPYGNGINFIPIRHSNQKNSLNIQMKMLINQKLCCNSIIEIYASPKREGDASGIQKHRIIFKNQKIIFYNRVTKEIEGIIEQISQSLYTKPFSLYIEIANGKLIISINKTDLISRNWQYLIDSIKFQLNGDIMLKQIKWQRFDQGYKQLKVDEYFHIFPSQAEIKLHKTQHFPVINFHDKVQIQQLCLYLTLLFANNVTRISVNKFYGLCCDIILNKQGSLKNQYSDSEFSFIRKLFKDLLWLSNKIGQIDIPERAIMNLNLSTKSCYQFLTACVLNEPFLSQSTMKNQIKVLSYLQQLLFGKKMDFRMAIQNRKIRIFANLVKSAMRMSPQIQQKYLILLQRIIITHEANQTLLKKITFLFYIVNSTKSQVLTKFYEKLMQKIFAVANHSQNEDNFHIKVICKYFLASHKNLKQIFVMANKDIKTKILDSMIDDEEIHKKCHSLFQGIPPHEFLQLSSWLIVYCKRTMFYFFENKRQTKLNLSNLMFFLKQITVAVKVETDIEHKQQFFSILNSFTKKSVKILSEKPSQEVAEQLQNFFCNDNFVRLIGSKIQDFMKQEIKDKNQESFLTNYFQGLFQFMPKFIILQALQSFRKLDEVYYSCFLYIMRLDYVDMFPVKTFSPFLQYIIEIIIKLKAASEVIKLQQVAVELKQYLQKSIKNYSKVSKINSPFLYSYPKMQRKIDFKDKNVVKKFVEKVRSAKQYQLTGGIYFKLMLASLHLIQMCPQQNLSQLVMFFLEKIGEKSKAQPIFRAVSDFIQVSKQTKKRSSIDVAMQEVQKQHQKYFQDEEKELSIINSPIRRSNSKIDIDTDLTPFFIDYFFMKMFMFLQTYSVKGADPGILKVCQSYSKLIIKYLKNFEHISEEMSEKNDESLLRYESIEDLYVLLQNEDNFITINEKINSPSFNRRLTNNQDSNVNFGFLQISNQESDKAFLGTPVKGNTLLKKRSTLNFELTSGKKRKKELISNIQTDILKWSEQAKKTKPHRFFRDESKQILFNQLVHKFFVLQSEANNFVKEAQVTKGKRLIGFLSSEGGEFVQQETLIEVNWEKLKQQIRQVYNFTSFTDTPLQLQRRLFPNLTLPFTIPSSSSERANKNRSQVIKFEQSTFINEKQIFLNSPYLNIETVVCLADGEGQDQINNICQISTPLGVYFCCWEFKNKNILFTTKSKKTAEGAFNQRIIKYGSPLCNIIAEEGKKFQIVPNEVLQIFYRKYNQVKNNSLEFFFKNGSSIYVIFYTEERAKKFVKDCKNKINQFRVIKIVENHIKAFQSQQYTEKWVSGELSNFDYIMLLNKYSGRTYCDLNQYYIFPWILKDYTSQYLDISNINIQNVFRDLKKPIGALRKQKLQRYLQKLSNLGESKTDQYLYGSHYSTSLFVFYYLVRLEPFTSLHKDMQGGDFDAPDRLFSSMDQMWECLMSQSSTSDIKQAIPQFYYFPTFLKNINSLNLGKKQSGSVVNSVQLPPWASNPADFILKMRICLESDYVSMHLNFWIDLIFGKDQKSIDKYNVFHPLSYVQNVNPEKIDLQNLDAIMSQITFFGQNPYVLFTKQHPKKKTKINTSTANNISLYTSLDFSHSTTNFQKVTKIWEEENLDLIYYVSSLEFKTKSIIMMKISGISKSAPTRNIDLDMQNSIHSLIRTIQKMDNPSMKRLLSQNNIELPEQKLITEHRVENGEIKIYIGVHKQTSLAKAIKLNYKFEHVKFNQIVFVAFGSTGLRVYDWDQSMIWDFSDDLAEVTNCFLEPGLIFFTTANGKLFCYDFFSNCKQLVFEYSKLTYGIDMMVYPERKLVTKKNQNCYKFLLVGDKRKIILLHYTHRVGKIQVKY